MVLSVMSQTISFIVNHRPVAQPRQRHRVRQLKTGKAFAQNYTPKDAPVQAFKRLVQLAAQKAMTGGLIEGPVSLEIVCVFKRPKRVRGDAREWMIAKPDWDNCGKSISDCLTGVLWHDDCQVARAVVSKMVAGPNESELVQVFVRSL